MKTAALLILIVTISLCCRADSNQDTSIGQPSIFWIDGQWQTWNNGAWTPYGQKPAAKLERHDHERRGSGANQPAPMRRMHSAPDSEPAPAQGLPIGAPNVAIGKPNVAIGQPTIGIGQPTVGIGQPTIAIGQPTIGIGQSTIGIGQTTMGIGQPTPLVGQTTIGIGQPTTAIGQRTIGIGQPTIGMGKPNVGIGKQSETLKPQRPPHINKPEISERAKKPQI